MKTIQLLKPGLAELPAYVAALKAGWSPDNIRKAAAAQEQLEKIAQDAAGFVASLDDPEAAGGPIPLPDGSFIERLPSVVRWIWDGEFCGVISFRWQRGGAALPSHVLGHIGFGVVPWKRGNGYARQALAALLPHAIQQGLAYVELTTDPANLASQHVIKACNGVLVERFRKAAAYGNDEALRFRIDLSETRTIVQDAPLV